MSLLRILIAGIILSAALHAQQVSTISGKLLDGANLVTSQVISLVSATKSFVTTTDADGNYRFDNVADGRYLLLYNNKQASVEVKGGSVSIAQLAEVVQIAASTNQTVEQVAKTVDTITAQEMRDRADFSLIESLRTIPGFRVGQIGGFGRLATIKTRGLRNQDTAVLIDGIRFRDVTAITGDASPFLSDFTLTSVSKIEVLRGSGSSLYGTNAVGGTVDFQTPRAQSGTHGQIGGAFGGLGLGRFRGNLSHGRDDGRFGITGGVSRTAYTKGIDGDDNAANTNVQTRVELNPFSRTNISGRIFFSDANVRLNTDPEAIGTLPSSSTTIVDAQAGVNFSPDANDPDRRQESRFFVGQLQIDQAITDTFTIGGYYQRLDSSRQNSNGVLGSGFQSASTSAFDGATDTGNAKFSWTPVVGNTLTAGYEFEREGYRNNESTPSGVADFFVDAGQKSNTFYLQNLANFLDQKLTLAGSFRVQKYSLDRPIFSGTNAPYSSVTLDDPPTAYTFDGAAAYFIQRSGSKLRVHVGNGYRVPSLYERFGAFGPSSFSPLFTAIGDPFLKPEKTIAFDAGVEQNIANGKVRVSATYFYTKLTDTIGYGNFVPSIGTTTRPFGGYRNKEGGISRGGEFSATFKPRRGTDVFTSYTFTNSDQLVPQLGGSGVTTTLGVPKHQYTLTATQRFGRAWVNFDLLATSSYLAPVFQNDFPFRSFVFRFGGNRRGDLTGGYTFALSKEKFSLRLFGTIENVFNQRYFENGFRTAKANARIGTTFAF